MPNWVCNHLIIHGENAVEVMNSLLYENSESENGYDVDFNKIIPMPEDLKIESGSVTHDCAKLYVNAMLEGCDAYKKYAALYVQAFGKDLAMSEDEQRKTMEYVMLHKDYEKNCPMFQTKADAYAYGKKALDNYEKYGAKDWYDWSIQNWGTKWNAHDTIVNDPGEANVYFHTAWSAPLPFLDALSRKYPELTFDFEFADEDIGYNTGKMTIKNGEILEGGFLDDASKEAYETYFELWGGEDEYRFNAKTGTYEYIDNEEAM